MTRGELPALAAQLRVERDRLAEIVAEIASLREAMGSRTPSRVEIMAAGGFLHNVYNAFENCMLRIAHGVDESVPSGHESHRLLLDQMSAPLLGLRPALLDRALSARVDEYRRFRHAFRHMYFFDLDWDRIRPLLDGAADLAAAFGAALDALLADVMSR
jgi:predicted GNAT family acetyltransferase